MIESSEVARVYVEAEARADTAGVCASSAHLLAAMWDFPNRGQMLLRERQHSAETVRAALAAPLPEEPESAPACLRARAHQVARSVGAGEVDCLHLLVAMARARDCAAFQILQRSGVSLAQLRNVAVSYLTGALPRRFRGGAPADDPTADAGRTAPCGAPGGSDADLLPRPATPRLTTPRQAASRVAAPAVPIRRRLAVARPETAATLESLAPTLAGIATDLTAEARAGGLDAVVGREREIEALVDILGKRRANNPLLLGPPGVGKTAIVEGLAVKLARGDADVGHLAGCLVVALDTGALVAGTSLRGAFSERLGSIKAEVAAAGRKIIVFIDEIHTLIGAGTSGEGPQDAAQELKAALARGTFPCIGATTQDEYRRYIERDAALTRRFAPIAVEEPSPEAALRIVQGAVPPYAAHHGRPYCLDAVQAAVWLSHRFVAGRQLPDKAFAALDLAGSRARRRGASQVTRRDVAEVVSAWTQVPMERLMAADAARFAAAEAALGEQLVGHASVLRAVARALRRGFAGLHGPRPMASLLFVGPTGVGKTELVKVLAEFMFGRRDALLRLDMSELGERHAVARLIGAQPGYVGYEDGGQLTEALRRRPFQIVLFDEIDKAHPDVLALLLQILDEGQLTDSRGRRVSFAHSLVVLTSNLGTEARGGHLGFRGSADAEDAERRMLAAARRALSPELWARLDETLAFLPLLPDQLAQVARLQLADKARTLGAEHALALSWDEAVVAFLLAQAEQTPELGARAVRRALQEHVDGALAAWVLRAPPAGAHAALRLRDDGNAIEVAPAAAPATAMPTAQRAVP